MYCSAVCENGDFRSLAPKFFSLFSMKGKGVKNAIASLCVYVMK